MSQREKLLASLIQMAEKEFNKNPKKKGKKKKIPNVLQKKKVSATPIPVAVLSVQTTPKKTKRKPKRKKPSLVDVAKDVLNLK
jgi:hypothetical protein